MPTTRCCSVWRGTGSRIPIRLGRRGWRTWRSTTGSSHSARNTRSTPTWSRTSHLSSSIGNAPVTFHYSVADLPIASSSRMPTSFDQIANQFLQHMGLASRVRRSIRAPSEPAIGLERKGAAFDYLFMTEDPNTLAEDAICFLQPNPTPPLFVWLPLSALTGMEWNGAYLFFETQDLAEVMFAEGTKGWGSRIKAVQVETMSAEKFFGLWTRWSVNPPDLGFVDIVATAAGLERHEDEEVGVITWSRPGLTEDMEASDNSDPKLDKGESARREAETRAVLADATNVSIDVASRHFVDAPDRFARLFEIFQDEPQIIAFGQIRPEDGQVPEEIDQVFQANAQRAYHALPQGSDEFRREFARRMYTLVVWG